MAIDTRPLRAFVRFDGSGRVVAGSLVLRKKKPKVGKWQEIQTYECCNDITTTTSTTTVAPVYAFENMNYGFDLTVCFMPVFQVTVYSATPTLALSQYLYKDAALTIPADDGYYCLDSIQPCPNASNINTFVIESFIPGNNPGQISGIPATC